MQPKDLSEVIACLPRERTLFQYHQGMYASLILSYILGAGKKVRWLKSTPFARLLKQPRIAAAMKNAGKGDFTPDLLPWPAHEDAAQQFVLTLGRWKGSHCRCCNQMSRRGHNLVLQLNLPGCHDVQMQALMGSNAFRYRDAHPTKLGKSTLSWARIDIDFELGEVLVEEIQTDWVRDAKRLANPDYLPDEARAERGLPTVEAAQQYLTEVLEPYQQLWEEATLAAVIWFVRQELGIHRIYFHSLRSGVEYKEIKGRAPPRFIYEDLPKRFGFTKTKRPPTFIMKEKRNQQIASGGKSPYWYVLDLDMDLHETVGAAA